jgi:hypothetical protein
MSVESFKAQFPGLCPVCMRWIRPGQSRIALLDVELPPAPDRCRYADRGRGWFVCNVPARSVRRLKWGHAGCVERWNRAHGVDEQEMIALERAADLRAMKAAVIRAERAPGPRSDRRPQRRKAAR